MDRNESDRVFYGVDFASGPDRSVRIDCETPLEPDATFKRRMMRREIFMRCAESLTVLSTCDRLQVGCVITDEEMTRVLAIGYNGNAKGLPNHCDHPDVPGSCGCIHAELNALLKVDGSVPNKIAFVTSSPCVMCAKAMKNANVGTVIYAELYRDPSGAELLGKMGIGGGQLVRTQL